jgi:hypothetical protein
MEAEDPIQDLFLLSTIFLLFFAAATGINPRPQLQYPKSPTLAKSNFSVISTILKQGRFVNLIEAETILPLILSNGQGAPGAYCESLALLW